ncbi:Gfo/Idh/MocA family protein [Chitinophaga lutea]
MTKRRDFLKTTALTGMGLAFSGPLTQLFAADTRLAGKRIGVIGLDTEHGPHFAKILNDPAAGDQFGGLKVTVAYPYGSRSIPSSVNAIPKHTASIKAQGVEVVDSIQQLLDNCDLVLLETNDGREHLQQALQVFKAGKPVFIDKPVAASLTDVVTIYRAAKHYNVPVFSSSTLRYIPSVQEVATGKIGTVKGADIFTPAPMEPTHPDLYWYGIHGVEMLFTMLGPECQSVTRFYTPDTDLVVGTWSGNRIGTLRGNRNGTWDFGGHAFGEKGHMPLGNFTGYAPLMPPIISFFQTGKAPADEKETIGIYAFMQAAQESRAKNGAPVSIASVMKQAEKKSLQQKI